MKSKLVSIAAACALAVFWIGFSRVSAAESPAANVPLTEAGSRLQAKYSARLTALQAQICKQVPHLDQASVDAFLRA